MQRIKTQNAFTLIEIMIVLAIVGVLCTLAVPHYESYLYRIRRNDAKIALIQFATELERYDAIRQRNQAITDSGILALPVGSPAGYYTLNVHTIGTSEYTVSATPVPDGPQANDPCGTLTLTHTQEKKPKECW